MNAKDYLEEIKLVNVTIKRTIRRIKRLEEMLEIHGITYDGDNISKSSEDKVTPAIIDLVEKRDYLRMIERYYVDKDEEASFIIGALSDPIEQYVVSLHYQDNLSFRKIGREVGYTHEGARKACERGVRKLDAIIIPLLQEYAKE